MPRFAARTHQSAHPRAGRTRSFLLAWLWRGCDATRDWVVRERNPFLQRALRRDNRKFTTGYALFLIFALVIVGGYLLDWFLRTLEASSADYLLEEFFTDGIPVPIGPTAIACVAHLTAAVTLPAAALLGRVFIAPMLRQEVLRGTLEHLQLIPEAEERWLWQLSAYPTLAAMLLGLCAAPVFLLAVFTRDWSPRDALGVALLYPMLGYATALWTPWLWNQKLRRTIAAVKRKQVAKKRGQEPLTVNSQMEAERAPRRLDDDEVADAPDHLGAVGQIWRWQQARFNRRQWMVNLSLVVIALCVCDGLSEFAVAWWRSAIDSLPAGSDSMIIGFAITWPVLTGRILLAPVPFYSFHLPPLPLVAALWLLHAFLSNLRLASHISSAENFWTPSRTRRRRIASDTFDTLFLFAFVGYCWPFLIEGGRLSPFILGASKSTSDALAAAWTIAIMAATLAGSAALWRACTPAGGDGAPTSQMERQELLAAAKMYVGCLAAYFVMCWLGGHSGIDSLWFERLPPTLCISLTYMMATLSCCAAAGRSRAAKLVWRSVWELWVWAPLLILVIAIMYWSAYNREFQLSDAVWVLLSPQVSLWSLLRNDQWNGASPWWLGPALQSAVAFFILAYVAMTHSVRRGTTRRTKTSSRSTATRWEMPRRALESCAFVIRRLNKRTTISSNWLVNLLAGHENPVLHYEMKNRLRREQWVGQVVILFVIQVIVAICYFISSYTSRQEDRWHGVWIDLVNGSGAAALTLVVCIGIIVFLGALVLGQVFDRDRTNGNLVFLFLTPLTDREILRGKLWPGLVYSGFLLVSGLPWLAVLTIIAVPANTFTFPIILLAGIAIVLSGAVYFPCANLVFGVRARRPNEGIVKAFLIVTGIDNAALIATAYYFPDEKLVGAFMAIAILATHLLLTPLSWLAALWSLRRQRYGDVAVGGEGSI